MLISKRTIRNLRSGVRYFSKQETFNQEKQKEHRAKSQTRFKKYDPEAERKKYGKPFQQVFHNTSIYRVNPSSTTSERLKVYAMNDGAFLVNHMWVPGSILLLPTRVYLWGVSDYKLIRPHTLDLFKILKPKPNFLVIGTGNEGRELDQDLYEYFRKEGMSVDSCGTFQAIGVFNSCVDDDIPVVAALLPTFGDVPELK